MNQIVYPGKSKFLVLLNVSRKRQILSTDIKQKESGKNMLLCNVF